MEKTLIRRAGVAVMASLVAVALIVTLAPSAALAYDGSPDTLDIHGSTTVEKIADASEAPFEAAYPGSDVVVRDPGGGSGFGIRQILGVDNIGDPLGDPRCDIGMSSRHLKPGELGYGVLCTWVIAKDAVCFIVPEGLYNAGVTQISCDQLKTIYEAEEDWPEGIEALTWHDVDLVDGADDGWPEWRVIPRARIIGSGTRDTFLERCGIDEAKEIATIDAMQHYTGSDGVERSYPRLESNPDMASAVYTDDDTDPDDKGEIGYVGLGFITEPLVLALWNPDTGEYVLPSQETIANETYYCWRNLYMLTRNDCLEQANEYLDDYMNWIHGHDGQDIARDQGFVKILPDWDVDYVANCDLSTGTCNGGVCDASDIAAVLGRMGESGDPGWIPEDVDNDGDVDNDDLTIVELHFSETWEWPAHP